MSDVALERLLEEEFNAPHALDWSRSALSTTNLELLGACLRSVILHRAPELADALPASILEQVARSIRDGERRPRVFELTGGWHVEVDARMVRVRPPLDGADM